MHDAAAIAAPRSYVPLRREKERGGWVGGASWEGAMRWCGVGRGPRDGMGLGGGHEMVWGWRLYTIFYIVIVDNNHLHCEINAIVSL